MNGSVSIASVAVINAFSLASPALDTTHAAAFGPTRAEANAFAISTVEYAFAAAPPTVASSVTALLLSYLLPRFFADLAGAEASD